jgi:hypothetical protein
MEALLNNLVPAKYMESTQTTQYTANGVKGIIDKMTVTNVSTTNQSFSVNIVEPSGSAGNNNLIIDDKTIYPGETYRCPEIVGHVIENLFSLSTIASAASSLTLDISGREIT